MPRCSSGWASLSSSFGSAALAGGSDGQSPADGERSVIPLGEARVGQEVVLVAIEGGHRLRHRLAEMGLMRGVKFQILNCGRPGPFLVLLGDTRLMLGRGMIHRVMVHPAED